MQEGSILLDYLSTLYQLQKLQINETQRFRHDGLEDVAEGKVKGH
jgi:hypothetical protein